LLLLYCGLVYVEYDDFEQPNFSLTNNLYEFSHQQLVNKPERANEPNAIPTNWFLNASQVNELDAIGGAGSDLTVRSLNPFGTATNDYLRFAGRSLAEQNIRTFLSLLNGEVPDEVNGFINDAIRRDGRMLCEVTEEGRLAFLNEALVRFEQMANSDILDQYFDGTDGRDTALRQEVIDDINETINDPVSFLGIPISDGDIATVLEEHFDEGAGGFNFDIGSATHREILGVELQRIVDERVNNGELDGFRTDEAVGLP